MFSLDNQDRGMGRRYAEDPRDYAYLLKDQLRAVDDRLILRNKVWSMFYKPINQGRTGTCVGHGWKHYMLAGPIIQTTPTKEPTAIQIYLEALPHDPWDNEGDLQYGTSVRAGAKALRARGIINTFNWEYTAQGCLDWLCGFDRLTDKPVGGPLVIGVNMYTSMLDTDAEGFLKIGPNDRVEGGHCMTLIGGSVKRGYVVGINSWDWRTWGYHSLGVRTGRFKMPLETLDRLLGENGEACAAQEQRLPTNKPVR